MDYSLKDLVQDLEIIQESFKKNPGGSDVLIQDLFITNHSNVGQFTVGSTTVGWRNVYKPWYNPFGWLPGNRWDGYFERLDTIMLDGGQIQYSGCSTAGFDPFAEVDPTNLEEWNPEDRDDWNTEIGQAYYARRMLSTIAYLTNTYVYASSDLGLLNVKLGDVETNRLCPYDFDNQYNRTDECLEFCVGPDGYSVSYKSCREPFIAALWEPDGAPYLPDDSIQTLWDATWPRMICPELITYGETRVEFYPNLVRS
jgi:hypothetical protein